MPFACLRTIIDISVTLLLWAYFIFGFLFFFSPFYLAAALLSPRPEAIFQQLNHYFYHCFFLLVRVLIPNTKFQISRRLKSLRSCVVVCNHRSYLDPILLISLFPRHKTIVKHALFRFPIFGWFLKSSGYIPSVILGDAMESAIKQLDSLNTFFASGGIFFVFPEGTRRKTRGLGSFNKGAFKIARRFSAPIKVLAIKNTDNLFSPGKFLFNTRFSQTISIELIDTVETGHNQDSLTVTRLMQKVHSLLESATM